MSRYWGELGTTAIYGHLEQKSLDALPLSHKVLGIKKSEDFFRLACATVTELENRLEPIARDR
jgi:hypothetical protein